MKTVPRTLLATVLLMATGAVAAAEGDESAQTKPEENTCIQCHGDPELWEGDTLRLYVTEKDLATDIHWAKGLRCQDCHGGDNTAVDLRAAHAEEDGFRTLKSGGDVPGFCGRCHSDIEYMRKYLPSSHTGQEAEYWTSGHGMRLKSHPDDTGVATCVSCHGHHGIRAVDDLQSPVYPTRVAETCAACHADEKLMADREYGGRLLGHGQYEQWKKSVHAEALLKKGDLSAPTCNDCHGNHGAVPPEVGSVANACGSCHVKMASLFAETVMKHRFEEANWGELPGCAACHGNHQIAHPTDEMLGMSGQGVCVRCHEKNRFGATLAGAEEAKKMRAGLDQLKKQITVAEAKLDEAERLGMEVRKPRFQLRESRNALTNARALVHSFAIAGMQDALSAGSEVAVKVEKDARKALKEYTWRRIWLAWSLVPILIVVGLLLLYIRALPIPGR